MKAIPVVLLLTIVRATTVEACSCVWIGDHAPEALFRQHALVVLVRVTSVESVPPPPEMADLPKQHWPRRVTLVPECLWKGRERAEYTAISNAAWNTCGYGYRLDERYVVYSKDGEMPTTQCTDPIYRLKDASKQVRWLNKAVHDCAESKVPKSRPTKR